MYITIFLIFLHCDLILPLTYIYILELTRVYAYTES